MNKKQTTWRDERGSMTIEFIAIFPLLLFAFCVFVQFAFIWMAQLAVHEAAVAAAHNALVMPEIPKMSSRTQEILARQAAADLLNKQIGFYKIKDDYLPEVQVEGFDNDNNLKNNLRITIAYELPLTVPLANWLIRLATNKDAIRLQDQVTIPKPFGYKL